VDVSVGHRPGRRHGQQLSWLASRPDKSDAEDEAEYDVEGAPDYVVGIVLGVNDDHDEFLPVSDPWDYDLADEQHCGRRREGITTVTA